MSDETRLQVGPGSSLSLLKARSGLIARGLRDATVLVRAEPSTETRRLAEQGDADAQYELGLECCGDFDHLNHEDYANGARWFRRAGSRVMLRHNSNSPLSITKLHHGNPRQGGLAICGRQSLRRCGPAIWLCSTITPRPLVGFRRLPSRAT